MSGFCTVILVPQERGLVGDGGFLAVHAEAANRLLLRRREGQRLRRPRALIMTRGVCRSSRERLLASLFMPTFPSGIAIVSRKLLSVSPRTAYCCTLSGRIAYVVSPRARLHPAHLKQHSRETGQHHPRSLQFRRRADECARPATAPRCRRRSSPRTVPLHSSAHCGGSFRHRCSPCGRKRTGSAAALSNTYSTSK